MAKKTKYFPVHEISLAIQNVNIRGFFPGFQFTKQGSVGVWTGEFQPTEISRRYLIQIEYKIYERPKVRVLSPPLPPDAPHMYPDGTLCLYWDKEWSWRRDYLIVDTILPWAALYLYFYELWCDTGEWHGPQSPHRGPKKREEESDGP